MSIACIIPARYNSSRFPGKLLVKVQGKTVLQRTFENASSSKKLNSLHVATDDERIAQHVQHIGGEVLWTSSAPRDGTERAMEAISRYPFLKTSESIMVLQGDHPCASHETIDLIAMALHADPAAVLSTAAAPIQNREDFLSPHVVKCVFDQNGNALYFSRSPIPHTKAENPLLAFAHIGIYCYRLAFLEKIRASTPTSLQEIEDLEQLKILQLGYRIKIALVSEITPSVDTPSDLVKLEAYLSIDKK
ncbi:MAG TPA: 3-deoxy-manno-octulosonate cytidylyltransferase [Chlamydiales bacterium]|nr:3-deoxy-manno-octulosonate cytidylyltransferase [Chlamydiales bacterium]